LKALILAAGEGRRLRPLTNETPKCMVNIFGKSLLEHQLGVFHKLGIHEITVVTGYKADTIKIPDVKYYKNEKYDSTNMVETLFCAESELNGSVIVSYGDIIFEKPVVEKLIKSNEDFSVVIDRKWQRYWSIRFENPIDDTESLKLDKDGHIKEIGQKASKLSDIEGQYIGLMKFQNDGLEFIKEFYHNTKEESKKGRNILSSHTPFEKLFMTDFLQGLINAGCNLKSIPIKNGWLELDTLNDFNIYNTMYQNNTLSEFIDLNKL
jgi:choline kinase